MVGSGARRGRSGCSVSGVGERPAGRAGWTRADISKQERAGQARFCPLGLSSGSRNTLSPAPAWFRVKDPVTRPPPTPVTCTLSWVVSPRPGLGVGIRPAPAPGPQAVLGPSPWLPRGRVGRKGNARQETSEEQRKGDCHRGGSGAGSGLGVTEGDRQRVVGGGNAATFSPCTGTAWPVLTASSR